MINSVTLSEEQQYFVEQVLAGKNVLVDACIGSGKTTAIQRVCDLLPSNKKILYLTYNKLLKCDARAKIRNANVYVTNYHGFAWVALRDSGHMVSANTAVLKFNSSKPLIGVYDVLIIDEYQDIETELAEELEYIKAQNPDMQIIAVGDMQQKIYDKTTLDVYPFITKFLGEHIKLEFTQCFRLCNNLAAQLGRIWNKTIVGVNEQCQVVDMTLHQAILFLADQRLSDILCLGARYGDCSTILNRLEKKYPEKFNKNTVYASIREDDSLAAINPTAETAIFTTFDSSKGLERNICVLCDYTEAYWGTRVNKPEVNYEIMRNIFCVAASRGKYMIIIVHGKDPHILAEQTLATPVGKQHKYDNVNISSMFDFNFSEDLVACYNTLEVKPIPTDDHTPIDVVCHDGLIDLSRCIGVYQEAKYFNNYDIDKDIELYLARHNSQEFLWDQFRQMLAYETDTTIVLQKKILFLAMLETNLARYTTQVTLPIVDEEHTEAIFKRLSTHLKPNERIQVGCSLSFAEPSTKGLLFEAHGYADAVKGNTVYELKFVNEFSYGHFLQCASYIVALKKERGVLWNVKTNQMFEIRVPDKRLFLEKVITSVTRHRVTKYVPYKQQRKGKKT